MAKTPESAIGLLRQVVPPATARARAEALKMQALIDRENGGFKLAPWDWQYYAERVQQADYNLDEDKIKPYLLLDRVLTDGVFFAANQLYGLSFKERKDLPVYHPDVRVFEVFDADGKSMALFCADYFKRDNKNGGAWMDFLVDPSGLTGQKPVAYNVANFTKPAPGMPALLTFDDVTTMFHEFGHALHGMFAHVQYPTLLNTPSDFVEFPSQLPLRSRMWSRLSVKRCGKTRSICRRSRRAIARRTSLTFGVAAIRHRITPTCGARCWTMTPMPGSKNTAE
jgi:peptidyl-dipeptidase Dcp